MTSRVAIAGLLCWLPLCAAAIADERPPNVLMIVSDDQAWTDYGFMGHKVIHTPNLDRLARASALFTRGYVPSSLCRPSLATMITGLYPHEHGIAGNDPPKQVDRSQMLKHIAAAPALPRLLSEHGYRSLQTGKWWEGNFKTGGFTHGMTHGDAARGGRHGDVGLAIGREGLAPIAEFLDERGERPFFLWYAPMLPHTPHNPPQRLLKKYAVEGRSIHIARYYAMCEWFDETCGELLAMLDKRGLAKNTLVVYVTDNGWIQNPDAAGFAPKSKRSPYDGGIRTPILLRWPGKIAPKKFETPVSSIDLAPTIRAACGVASDEKLPGVNLLELVVDGKPIAREALFGEIFAHDVADLDKPAASLQFRWCIEGDWKLILPHQRGAGELYNLAADAHEEKNQAAEHPEIVERLTRRLDAWWRPE
jgi:uncharacterized sulfatase